MNFQNNPDRPSGLCFLAFIILRGAGEMMAQNNNIF
jgi:hypothetical protein